MTHFTEIKIKEDLEHLDQARDKLEANTHKLEAKEEKLKLQEKGKFHYLAIYSMIF